MYIVNRLYSVIGVYLIQLQKHKHRTKRKEVKTMERNELTAKVRELKELKAMADELSNEITAIEDELKNEMAARGVDELAVDVFKITWKSVVSHRFDSSAFKKANADLYNLFVKESTSKRFTVA